MGDYDVCLSCTRADCPGECELVGERPGKRHGGGKPAIIYEAFGERDVGLYFATKYGIAKKVLYQRVKGGMSMEDAIKMGPPKPRDMTRYTYNGRTMSIKAWAEACGMERTTLYYRVKVQGMSLEDAIMRGREGPHEIRGGE